MRALYPILLTVIALSGCEINSSDTKVQYMPDMADAPTVKAQENYLEPPEHSIPINGVLYPASFEDAEKELKNPYPPSETIIAEGKYVYENTCIACHGADGKGGHSLGDKFVAVPSLATEALKARPDGFFFHIMTFGRATMPSYNDKTSQAERWKIVHYIRTLQQ